MTAEMVPLTEETFFSMYFTDEYISKKFFPSALPGVKNFVYDKLGNTLFW